MTLRSPGGGAVRRLVAAASLVLLLCLPDSVDAEESSVPAGVQVALVAKVAAYDKHFVTRAGERARIMIVMARGDADSARVAAQLKAAFADVERVGGLPHDDSVVEYTDAPTLARECRDQRVAIVYLTPGLGSEVEAIGRALDGMSILSVGAVSGYAAKGAVIDFSIEAGKPRIALNLGQARRQDVSLLPELVRIMRVVE